MDRKALGNRVKEERAKLHVTQQKLAEFLNLSTDYLGCIERGERNVSLEKLVIIASYLNVSLDYLVFGNLVDTTKDDSTELEELIDKCSVKENEVVADVIKALLPHLKELAFKK